MIPWNGFDQDQQVWVKLSRFRCHVTRDFIVTLCIEANMHTNKKENESSREREQEEETDILFVRYLYLVLYMYSQLFRPLQLDKQVLKTFPTRHKLQKTLFLSACENILVAKTTIIFVLPWIHCKNIFWALYTIGCVLN